MTKTVVNHHHFGTVPTPPESIEVTPEMEVLTPILNFKVEVTCPECMKGTLVENYNTWDSIMLTEIYYQHTCTSCGHETYMTKTYPRVETRDVDGKETDRPRTPEVRE